MRACVIVLSPLLTAIALAACDASRSPSPAAAPASPTPATVADRLRSAADKLDDALTAAGADDLAKAREAYDAFEQRWDQVDDDVKDRSSAAYDTIRDAVEDARENLSGSDKPDAAKAREVLDKLKDAVDQGLSRLR
jgi:ABC-type transporter lipoprotein component MlaA